MCVVAPETPAWDERRSSRPAPTSHRFWLEARVRSVPIKASTSPVSNKTQQLRFACLRATEAQSSGCTRHASRPADQWPNDLVSPIRRQLERVLRTYVDHYNRERPHRALGLVAPHPRCEPMPAGDARPVTVRRRDRLAPRLGCSKGKTFLILLLPWYTTPLCHGPCRQGELGGRSRAISQPTQVIVEGPLAQSHRRCSWQR
jgi:Integrase core domain